MHLDRKGMKGTKEKKIISLGRSQKLSRGQIEEQKINVKYIGKNVLNLERITEQRNPMTTIRRRSK